MKEFFLRKQAEAPKKMEQQEPIRVKKERYLGDKELQCVNHPYCKTEGPIKKDDVAFALYKTGTQKDVLIGRAHSPQCAEEAVKKLRREKRFVA